MKKTATRPSHKATAGKKRIFLDYAAITPVDAKVEQEMKKVQKNFLGNPSSLHNEGESAKNALEEARIKIARILHCRSNEIFFTSGGTESLNIAILGTIRLAAEKGINPHIITSSIEHPAVLEPIKFLVKSKKAEVSFVVPDKNGIINPESVREEIKENTVLVAIQHANNEIGTIQPIREISKILKDFEKAHPQTPSPREGAGEGHDSTFKPLPQGEGRRGGVFPYLLVDASQSALYADVSIERLGADMLVLDGIKIYGPRGMGILVAKRGVEILPLAFGGGQERSLRPGTENVAGAAGLAKALEIAVQKREGESKRLKKLRDYAIQKILKEISNSSLNGSLKDRLPNNINICLATPKHSAKAGQKIDSEFLVIKLDTMGFAVSAASACHTLTLENGSYVIESLGKPECASSSLRITLGRDTKKSDLDELISALKKIIVH